MILVEIPQRKEWYNQCCKVGFFKNPYFWWKWLTKIFLFLYSFKFLSSVRLTCIFLSKCFSAISKKFQTYSWHPFFFIVFCHQQYWFSHFSFQICNCTFNFEMQYSANFYSCGLRFFFVFFFSKYSWECPLSFLKYLAFNSFWLRVRSLKLLLSCFRWARLKTKKYTKIQHFIHSDIFLSKSVHEKFATLFPTGRENFY